jgi:RNA polymerase sigma-70 factor (ECF subfamily)
MVYRWCRRSGVVADDAADVLQEVLAAVARHVSEFRRNGSHGSFTAWLATVTRSKVCDHYRRRHGRAEACGGTTAQHRLAEIPQPPEPSHETVQPDAEAAACLSRRVLDMIQAEFEPGTWQAFWRTAVEGQSPALVAEELQMSAAAVYMAKSRVLRRLRQTIEELPE